MASSSIFAALYRLSLFQLTRKPCPSPSSLSFSYISKPHKPKDRTQFRFYSMASSDSKGSAANNPGLHTTRDEATKGYFMQQTMFRNKIQKSVLIFILVYWACRKFISLFSSVFFQFDLKRVDVPEMKFSIYFLGYEDVASAPSDPVDRIVWTFGKPATVKLTHLMLPTVIGVQKATLSSKDITMGIQNLVALCGSVFNELLGFLVLTVLFPFSGHIGITVDDTVKTCERFERLGIEFVKNPL
ncbi:hypothetical protein CRYUN_Cryun02cG0207000 [Craigia yunnanensis]